LLVPSLLRAQGVYTPLGTDTYHLFDRLEIKSGKISRDIHSSTKPFRKKAISLFVDSFEMSTMEHSNADWFNFSYLEADNMDYLGLKGRSRTPVLKYFYTNRTALYSTVSEDFELYINPVLNFSVGMERGSYGDPPLSIKEPLFNNTRGMEARGLINRKVGFYTYLADNQARVPLYVHQWVDSSNVFPEVGFLKKFKDSKYPSKNGYDFFQARGYITFDATRNIHVQFGHDRNFIGNGYRSMILSDFAKEYLFLKANTTIWKINYQNLFTQFTDFVPMQGTQLQPKKYGAFHHLSLNLGRHVNIGLFEGEIFSRKDSNGSGSFDINYLNPIIFYRAIEQNLGSPDNAFVGADLKVNAGRHYSFYGQFLLDEFLLKELKAGNRWWANKFALQAGLKYIDVLSIHNLDLQLEYNSTRPYTYTHARVSENYTHYNQSLAHPLGSNFREFIAIVRYQPLSRWTVVLKQFYAIHGIDTGNVHWGGNILENYHDRPRDYGNVIGQGVKNNIYSAELQVTFQPWHNVYLDLRYYLRNVNSALSIYDRSENILTFTLRMNAAMRRFEF
jgi:hypothetical protein